MFARLAILLDAKGLALNTYDTSALPLGSTSPKVLYNNASNFDEAMNGAGPSWIDRFSKRRETWEGIENRVTSYLESLGFVWIGDYAADLVFTSRSQYMVRDGIQYRVAPGTTLPYTTTGVWATEQTSFVQFSNAKVFAHIKDFGATGDGVTDDSAAFNDARDYFMGLGGTLVIDGPAEYYLPQGWQFDGMEDFLVTGEPGALLNCKAPTLNKHILQGYNCSNMQVNNLKFKSNNVVRTLAVFAVYFQDCSSIVVANCEMQDCLSSCWMNHCTDSHMYRNLGKNTSADGFHFSHGCRDCSFVENETRDCKDDHFSITTYVDTSIPANAALRAKRIRVINNVASGGTWGNGVAIYGADNVDVLGNTIRNVARNGVGILPFNDPVASSEINVLGNTIDGAGSALKIPVSDATGGDPASDPPVGNADNCGVCVYAATDVVVKGNTIKNVTSGGAIKSGVFFTNARRVTVKGNTIEGIDGRGVFLDPATAFAEDFFIEGNNFRNISDMCVDIANMNAGTLMVKDNSAIAPYGTGSGFFMRFTGIGSRFLSAHNVGADATKTFSYVSCTNKVEGGNIP